jgi:hypothetical protein
MDIKSLLKIASKTLEFTLAVNGLTVFAFYLSVAPVGTSVLLAVTDIVMLLLAASVFAVPASLILAIWPGRRKSAARLLIAAIIFSPITANGLSLAYSIRREGLVRLAARSRPLVNAIRQYELKYEKPPENLRQLAPEFIAEVPGTGIGAYPEYEYAAAPPGDIYEGNPWVLRVDTLSNSGFDQFMYWPKHNYPRSFGGSVEPVEDWAYIHE